MSAANFVSENQFDRMDCMDEKKLGTKSIFKLMISYSLPAIVVISAFSVYNITDGIFIGRAVGSNGLAAVSISTPVIILFACISCVVGMGGNTLVGIALGEGNRKKASERFSLATVIMLIIIVFFSVILIVFTQPIARLVGANDEIIDGAAVYLKTTGFFCFSLLLASYLGLSMETAGKPAMAMVGHIAGVVINILLDYIFIMRLGMGVFGAALATGIGSTVSAILLLIIIFMPSTALKFVRVKFDLSIIAKMLYNGMSEGLNALSASITAFLYNIVIMRHVGEAGLAAFAVIQYSFLLISSVMIGAAQGLIPIVSYNYGAKSFLRVNKTLKMFSITNVFLATATTIFMLLSREWMFALFSEGSPELTREAIKISNYYIATFLFVGLNDIFVAYFTAIADAKSSAILAMVRVLVFKGSFILLLPLLFGTTGIWITTPVSELFALILCLMFVKTSVRKNKNKLPAEMQTVELVSRAE